MPEQHHLLGDEDIQFDPASSVDTFGRVFWYKGGVYRAVDSSSVGLANEIVNNMEAWSRHGLIGTRLSDIRISGCPLVLSHDTVRFRSYCTEWTPLMLRDAALTYLRLQLELVSSEYVLTDAHPWNVLFDGCSPVYVDVGSIRHFEPVLLVKSLEEFRIYFLLPLMLFSLWGTDKTYRFLKRPIPNAKERLEIADQIRLQGLRKPRWLTNRLYIRLLIRKIRNLPLEYDHTTEWSSYLQSTPAVGRPESYDDKQRIPYEVLEKHSPCTVLDIGCNKGWYSILADSLGCKVISTDVDIKSIDTLYRQSSSEDRKITPLFVDICSPTTASGLNGVYPDFIQRAAADVVLLMAVVHHISYKQKLSFRELAQRTEKLAKKVAVVEFIPSSDIHVNKWDQQNMEWYTRENFIEAFMKEFGSYEVFPSVPFPREVFVFRK